MEVTVEEKGAHDRHLNIRVPASRVDALIEAEYRKLAGQVKLPGFRPGRVPRKVLEQRFHGSVMAEVMEQLLTPAYAEALRQSGLRPVGSPVIKEMGKVEAGNDFTFTAAMQIFPDLKPTGYQGLSLTRPVAQVTDADVDRVLEDIRQNHATFEVAEGRQAENGDRVVLDFKGFVDGEAFDGGAAQDYHLELGAGRFIPGFEEQLVGIAAGDSREVKVTFPADYGAAHLAGKDAVFQCDVKEVRVKRLPELDDALAETVGVKEGGLEKLKEQAREGLEKRAAEKSAERVKKQILEQLLEANRMELPSQLVDQEVEGMLERAKQDAKRQGITLEQVGLSDEKLKEEYRKPATDRVILGLTLGAVATAEQVEVSEEAMNGHLQEMAVEYNVDLALLQSWLKENPGRQDEIRGTVLENLVMEWITGHATVTEEPVTLEALMNPPAEEESAE